MHLAQATTTAGVSLAAAGEAALGVASSARQDGDALRGAFGAGKAARHRKHPLAGLRAQPPDGSETEDSFSSGGRKSRSVRAASLLSRVGRQTRSDARERGPSWSRASRLAPSTEASHGARGLAAAAHDIQRELLPSLADLRTGLQNAVVELEAQANHVGAAVDRFKELLPTPRRTVVTPQDRIEDLVRRTAASISSSIRRPPAEQSALDPGHSFYTPSASESQHRPASSERAAVARVQKLLHLLRKQVAETGDQLEALEASRRMNRGWDATLRLDSWAQPAFVADVRQAGKAPTLGQVIARARAVAQWAPVVSAWGAQLLVTAATAPKASPPAGDDRSSRGPHSARQPTSAKAASAGVGAPSKSSSPSGQSDDDGASAATVLGSAGFTSPSVESTPCAAESSPAGFSACRNVASRGFFHEKQPEAPISAEAGGAVLTDTVRTAKGVFSEASRWDERIAGDRGPGPQKYAWAPRLLFGIHGASGDTPLKYAGGLRDVPAATVAAAADALRSDRQRLSAFAMLAASSLERDGTVQGLSPREAVKLGASFEACARACVDCDALADDATRSRGVFSTAGSNIKDSTAFDWTEVGWKPKPDSAASGPKSARGLRPKSPLASKPTERSHSATTLASSVDDRHAFGHGFTGLVADCLDGGGPLGSLRRPARLTTTVAKVRQICVARFAERVLVAERRVRLACLRQHLLSTLAQLADVLAESDAEVATDPQPGSPGDTSGSTCRRTEAAPQGVNGLAGKSGAAACLRVAIRQLVVPLSAMSCRELLHSAHLVGVASTSDSEADGADEKRKFSRGLYLESAALASASGREPTCFRVLGLLREAEEYDVSLTAQPWLGWHDEAALHTCDSPTVPVRVASPSDSKPQPPAKSSSKSDSSLNEIPAPSSSPKLGKMPKPSLAARRGPRAGFSLWKQAKARLGIARALAGDGGASLDAHRLRHVIESLAGQEAGRASDAVLPDEFVRCVGGREQHPDDDTGPADHAAGHVVRKSLFEAPALGICKSQRMRNRAIRSEASLVGWAGIRSRLLESGEAFSLFDLHVRTLLIQAVLQGAVSDSNPDGTSGGRALLALDSRTVQGPLTLPGASSRMVNAPMSVVVMLRATPEGLEAAATATGEPLRVVWDPLKPANRTAQTKAASRADAQATAAIDKATIFSGIEPSEADFRLSNGPCNSAGEASQSPLWWDSLRLTAWLPFDATAAFSALRVHERLQPRSLACPSAADLDSATAESAAWKLQPVTEQSTQDHSGPLAAGLAKSERLLTAADRLCKRLDKAFASLPKASSSDGVTTEARPPLSPEQQNLVSIRQRASAARAKAMDSVCRGLTAAVDAWEADLSTRAAPRLFAPPARRRLLRCLLLALPWPDAAIASLVSHEDCPRPTRVCGELPPLGPQSAPSLLTSAAAAAKKQLEPIRLFSDAVDEAQLRGTQAGLVGLPERRRGADEDSSDSDSDDELLVDRSGSSDLLGDELPNVHATSSEAVFQARVPSGPFGEGLQASTFQYLHDVEVLDRVVERAAAAMEPVVAVNLRCCRQSARAEQFIHSLGAYSGAAASRAVSVGAVASRWLVLLVLAFVLVRIIVVDVILALAVESTVWADFLRLTGTWIPVSGDASRAMLGNVVYALAVVLIWSSFLQSAAIRTWALEGARLGRSVLPARRRDVCHIMQLAQSVIGAAPGSSTFLDFSPEHAGSAQGACCCSCMRETARPRQGSTSIKGNAMAMSAQRLGTGPGREVLWRDSCGMDSSAGAAALWRGSWAGVATGGHTAPWAAQGRAGRLNAVASCAEASSEAWKPLAGEQALGARARYYSSAYLALDRLCVALAFAAQAGTVALFSDIADAMKQDPQFQAVVVPLGCALMAIAIEGCYRWFKRATALHRRASRNSAFELTPTVYGAQDEWHDTTSLLAVLIGVYLVPAAAVALVPDRFEVGYGLCATVRSEPVAVLAPACTRAAGYTQLACIVAFCTANFVRMVLSSSWARQRTIRRHEARGREAEVRTAGSCYVGPQTRSTGPVPLRTYTPPDFLPLVPNLNGNHRADPDMPTASVACIPCSARHGHSSVCCPHLPVLVMLDILSLGLCRCARGPGLTSVGSGTLPWSGLFVRASAPASGVSLARCVFRRSGQHWVAPREASVDKSPLAAFGLRPLSQDALAGALFAVSKAFEPWNSKTDALASEAAARAAQARGKLLEPPTPLGRGHRPRSMSWQLALAPMLARTTSLRVDALHTSSLQAAKERAQGETTAALSPKSEGQQAADGQASMALFRSRGHAADVLWGKGPSLATARGIRWLRTSVMTAVQADAAVFQTMALSPRQRAPAGFSPLLSAARADAGHWWASMQPVSRITSPLPARQLAWAPAVRWIGSSASVVVPGQDQDRREWQNQLRQACEQQSTMAPPGALPVCAVNPGRLAAYGGLAGTMGSSARLSPNADLMPTAAGRESMAAGLIWARSGIQEKLPPDSAPDLEAAAETLRASHGGQALIRPGKSSFRGMLVLGREVLHASSKAIAAQRQSYTMLPSAEFLRAMPRLEREEVLTAPSNLAESAFGVAGALLLCVLPLSWVSAILLAVLTGVQFRVRAGAAVTGSAASFPRASPIGPSGGDAFAELVALLTAAACLTNASVALYGRGGGWDLLLLAPTEAAGVTLAACLGALAFRRAVFWLVSESPVSAVLMSGLPSSLKLFEAFERPNALLARALGATSQGVE